MMRKRMMASLLALTMVLGMSLNSFAALRNTTGAPCNDHRGGIETKYTLADGTVVHERNTRHVSISDFLRLRDVCNEKYSSSLVKRVKNAEGGVTGTAEPVGSDVTEPEEYDSHTNAVQKKLEDRKYTGRTLDQKHVVYGPVNEKTGKPTIERIDTQQIKTQSMHDYVSQGKKIRFVNGIRLSDTEFVIRVDCSIQDTDEKAPQSFRGDYFVSVIPYREKETGRDANGKLMTEAINVPDEFGDMYNNKKFGPAWFFCMLFDETQPVGKQDIVGYLVAQRITRWPDWSDLRYYYPGVNNLLKYEKVDGSDKTVAVYKANPTQIARESATTYEIETKDDQWFDKGTEMKDPATGEKKFNRVNGQKVVKSTTFVDVSMKYPRLSYAYPTASVVVTDKDTKETLSDWLDKVVAENPRW